MEKYIREHEEYIQKLLADEYNCNNKMRIMFINQLLPTHSNVDVVSEVLETLAIRTIPFNRCLVNVENFMETERKARANNYRIHKVLMRKGQEEDFPKYELSEYDNAEMLPIPDPMSDEVLCEKVKEAFDDKAVMFAKRFQLAAHLIKMEYIIRQLRGEL